LDGGLEFREALVELLLAVALGRVAFSESIEYFKSLFDPYPALANSCF
jgi:hypothetical protein